MGQVSVVYLPSTYCSIPITVHDQNAISAQCEQRPFNKDGRQDHPIIGLHKHVLLNKIFEIIFPNFDFY